jgi:hypothetical protein
VIVLKKDNKTIPPQTSEYFTPEEEMMTAL